MSEYKFKYFNFRARGEPSRILFALADVDYEDIRIEWADFGPGGEEEKTPFGQLPTLEVEGTLLCQSHVIEAYLARKFGFAGKTDLDRTRAAMIVACVDDYITNAFKIFAESDEEKKKALIETWKNEQMPTGLKKFSKLLESNGGTYFVGDDMTYADIVFSVYVDDLAKVSSGGVPADWDKWPKLAALKDRVFNHPKIAAWIAKRPQSFY